MGNAKHIDGIWALAVAVGVGMAVANAPAVAWAEPADSGVGSTPGGSSPSSPPRDSGSAPSDTPSSKGALSARNNPVNRHLRPLNLPGGMSVSSSGGAHTSTTKGSSASTTKLTEPAGLRPTLETPGTDERHGGQSSFRPGSHRTSAEIGPAPVAVKLPTADRTTLESGLDATHVVAAPVVSSFAPTTQSAAVTSVAPITMPTMSSTGATAAKSPRPPASVVVSESDNPMSRMVSTLVDAVVSPFANSAPNAPVHAPAVWTLLAFARREFEQALSIAPMTVNPPAGQTTTGQVTDAVDPGFISSTMDFFGLFTITSAGDPDDDNFVAFVLETPFFTDILTSGADPEDNLGFGPASIGVAGHTVNTFISPFLTFSIAIPVTDPFAELFIALIQGGFI